MTPPWEIRHHVPPPEGADQPLRPAAGSRRSQGGGGAGFVTVHERLFAPLQGLDPNNVLMGGYGWLSKTDGGATYHPGLDLNSGSGCNADEGAGVVAPLAGVVRAVLWWDGYTPGEGNHLYIELDDPCCPAPTYLHFDHLLRIDVAVGQRVMPGEPVGACGRSGGWDCSHLHTELMNGPPKNGWYTWPYGWSRAQVEAAYQNPQTWWQAATALVLAEGNRPIPPEVVADMSQWELVNYVLVDLYDWAGLKADFNPDSAINKAWADDLHAGRYHGRPRTAERRWGTPDRGGVWQEFDLGIAVWTQEQGASWNG